MSPGRAVERLIVAAMAVCTAMLAMGDAFLAAGLDAGDRPWPFVAGMLALLAIAVLLLAALAAEGRSGGREKP